MPTTPSREFTLPFLKKEKIAKDTYSFYFSLKGRWVSYPDSQFHYDFFSGQYNRVTLPIIPTDDRGSSHFFTIASSPLQNEFLMITTKITQKHSDFKQALMNIREGAPVQFFGPMGGFFLREEDIIPRVFLAGGIGITPFHSMIVYAAEKKLQIPMTFIVSFSTSEDVVFYEELKKIVENNSFVKVIYTISHPKLVSQGHFETGRISEELIRKYVSNVQAPIFMIVGPPSMVDATVEILQKMKIPEEHIKVEHFTGY